MIIVKVYITSMKRNPTMMTKASVFIKTRHFPHIQQRTHDTQHTHTKSHLKYNLKLSIYCAQKMNINRLRDLMK